MLRRGFTMNPPSVKLYIREHFPHDVKAGFITAVVALPLAIAFAIASGVEPIMGLYTAVIAGILGSGLAGSRFSITGPTGAMTVIILSTITKFGLEGLLLAGFLAGIMQIGFGIIRLGKLVKFIPFPIISGFTAGIGAIIFAGQIPNALGLALAPQEHLWKIFGEIASHLSDANSLAVAIALSTIMLILFWPRLSRNIKFLQGIPPSMVALISATLVVYIVRLPVPVVGEIPTGLPSFSLPLFTLELVRNVLPAAFTIALLGAIEALLCAVVCDGMTNTRHNSDKELLSQGICNVVLPFVGGIPCTAAVARSAVAIREGARTRMAGIFHGLFILCTLLFLAPAARFIPKAFLAGILMVVSAKMINIREFKTIIRLNPYETAVLVITFLLTIFTDLVFAVQMGMLLAIFLLFMRFTKAFNVSHMDDYPHSNGLNAFIFQNPQLKELVSVYTLHGPFFFGAMNVFDRKLNEHLQIRKPIIILRMKHVAFIDSTAIIRLNEFIKERMKAESLVYLTDLTPEVKKTLLNNKEFTSLQAKDDILHSIRIFDRTKEAIKYVEDNFVKK